jgi:hypothetical protein
LGNIAGDGPELREAVLKDGAMQPLLDVITREMNEFLAATTVTIETPTGLAASPSKRRHNFNLSTLRIAIWALSNFCRGNGKSDLDWDLVRTLRQLVECNAC